MNKNSIHHPNQRCRRLSPGAKRLITVLGLFCCLLVLAIAGLPDAFIKVSANRIPARSAVTNHKASSQQGARANLWQEVPESSINGNVKRAAGPKFYLTLQLNQTTLAKVLAAAPLEFTEAAKTKPVELMLPLADGSYQTFRVVESPIMDPALAAKFPEIKTYSGQGVQDPSVTTRFDWTPTGLHGIVLANEITLLEPYSSGDTENYVSFFQRDVPVDSFECGVSEAEQEAAIAESKKHESAERIRPNVTSGASLRTYRLAVAATAEYTQTYGGGTVSGALEAITTTINYVDAIYEREVAVRLVLVAGETSIIFTDSASDGYTSDTVGLLGGENQTKLDTVIGDANYDIGHVFDGRNDSPGFFSFQGQASIASVCVSGRKARGVSITRSVQPYEDVAFYSTAHEMGHQFSATHTFNAATGNCASQRTASTAYEPGTGSTIMGYRFTCGTQDLMSSNTYFHNASLEQIINYTSTNSCGTTVATGNSPPVVSAATGFVIPQNTPFMLTATGSDPNGDTLTFDWEEFDLGAASPPNTDDGSRPIFRSFAPMSNPARSFPNLSTALGGTPSFESLPVTNRTLNFRVTARDNRSGGGGINSAAAQVQVTTSAGPFTVSQPTTGTNWSTNSMQTVSWNVANTSSAPVSCGSVTILLSVNGGYSFPIVLAADTPNDGSEVVPVPGTATAGARVKVAGLGNIFFNISQSFQINGATNTVPTISSFTPGSGGSGDSVTVTGTNFISPSAVTFNGVAASFTVESNTTIVAVVPAGATTGPIRVVTSSGTATSASNFTAGPTNIQLSSATYSVGEAGGAASVTVSRSGATAAAATVDYKTTDTAGLNNCNVFNGVASSRCDYATAVGTLRFAAGETTKTISVPIVDDAYAEGNEGFTITLSNAVGEPLGTPSTATVTINDNEMANGANPIDQTPFFVRQHYIDFLGREPDFEGYVGWLAIINNCAPGNTNCDRIHVSSAFFRSPEFQERGYFVYRFYSVSFGRKPDYAEFIPDIAKASGFLTDAELEAARVAFINEFMTRPAFVTKYVTPGLTNAQYVDLLLSTANVTSPSRDFWVNSIANGTLTRAQVLRQISESTEVYNKYYNQAFVVMQYFGYLRRDPDGQYLSWIQQLDSSGDFRVMVNGFMNSTEYRIRFGP